MDKNQNLEFQLPPGFRFHPSDEELIVHYLRNKVTSCPLPASFIAEIDLYKYNPWELPSKALFGEDEWYFFTPRDRKYPNGMRPNRAAGSGYWKATGTDKPILTPCGTKSIGLKKALVFYKGRPPKGYKTDWIMHEYRLHESMNLHTRQIGSMRLDEWVLCRVRLKTNSTRSPWEDSNEHSNEPITSDFQQVNGNSNQELVKNYVYNEFPMLPHILASKSTMPNSISMASSAGFGCSDGIKANASVHADKLNLLGAQFLASSAESLRSPMKRKFVEENQLDLYAAPNKKLIEVEVYYGKQILEANVSRGYNYNNFDQWTSMMQPQELNSLAFSGFI